jgi:dihydrofolate reductase
MQVLVLAVVSLDGCLTKHDDVDPAGLSSADDTRHFHAALRTCDAIIVGRITHAVGHEQIVNKLRANPDGRRRIVMTRSPQLFANDTFPGSLDFTDRSAAEILEALRTEGRQRVAVLGGGEIYNLFLEQNLVDELQITVEARVFGTGTRLAGLTNPIDPSLELTNVDRLGSNTVLLTMRRASVADAPE